MENKEESPGGEEAQTIDKAEQVAAGVEEDIESLRKAIAEERDKAERYLANWQRAQADLINYKKRVEQDKGEAIKFANATLLLNLLPVNALEAQPVPG